MELTQEQKAIIASKGNIRINAVAGSGKTTTIIEYARTRPKSSRILYLAFNKSVKLEAARKFEKLGLTNVRVETAHSLAYKYIVIRFNYKVRALGYRATEIVDMLKMSRLGERHAEYILANHVLRFMAYYCNSDVPTIEELNYRDTVAESKAKAFVNANYGLLVKYTKEFLRMMQTREIEVTHDYYLKKFQLTCPKMRYDYILFDEGQDASPAMLDVFFKQDATKVIVGDRHQQIYGWRFAVNSLEKADYTTYNLSTSFRFDQDVANLAMEVLKYKDHLILASPLDSARDDNAPKRDEVKIIGAGKFTEIKSRAILARTNLGLLLKAIHYVTETHNPGKLYFEGNINSYTYAEDGTSLYDVLNLQTGNKFKIRDRLIRSMRDMEDLQQYIDKTGDPQLGMMVEIVEAYGDKIPGILAKIKSLHVENEKRDEATLIFSTVHRCKGLEYDEIELVSDFIKEDNVIRNKPNPKKPETLDVSKTIEEINLLYVAVTRARVKMVIWPDIIPKSFAVTERIGPPLSTSTPLGLTVDSSDQEADDGNFELEMQEREYEKYMERKFGYEYGDRLRSRRFERAKERVLRELGVRELPKTPKTHEQMVEEARKTHKQAYAPWTTELEIELKKKYESGVTIESIALEMGRSKYAIEMRLEKMNLKKAS